MDMVVHYPKAADKQDELSKMVAMLYTESIVRYVEKLNCPAEQRLAIMDAILETVKTK